MRRESHRKRAFFRAFDRAFDGLVRAYDRGVRTLFPRRVLVLASYAALGLATLLLFRAVPTGFVPDEDQGYFITSFQLPDGASIDRTLGVAKQIEEILLGTPGIVGANLFGGFDALTGTSPANVGSVFVTLAPWEERAAKGQTLESIFAAVRPPLAAIPGARVLALNPAPIRGLSRTGGFEFQHVIEDARQLSGEAGNFVIRQVQPRKLRHLNHLLRRDGHAHSSFCRLA